MAYSRGGSAVRRYMATLPGEIERKILRGAARAGATVIADEARDRARSRLVAGAIDIKVRGEVGRVVATIQITDDWARTRGIWLEYGTDPHYITVDDGQRAGRTTTRINRLAKDGVLVIAGQPVGTTVFHPGAQAHPFLRPALDTQEAAAITAAQAFIDARVGPAGVRGDDDSEDGE